MIAHLLSPVPNEQRPNNDANLSAWGKNIRFPDAATADWTKIHIAIVSTDDDFGKACRQRLYTLAYPFKSLNIVDLGQVNGDEIGLTEVIAFLVSKQILPIVLGGDTYAILRAYEQNPVFCNYVSINNMLDYDSNQRDNNTAVLNRWAEQKPHLSLHYTNIGFQIHHAMPDSLDWLDRQGFEVFRLGKIRQNLEDAEPLVRDADLLTMQLSALRRDAVAESGFTIEESCRLVRYAGMSDRLSVLNLGHIADNDYDGAAAAQLIWYFCEGVSLRKGDYPIDKRNFTPYLVELDEEPAPVTFWKSRRSDRWWLELPDSNWLPCSYEDYSIAAAGELSERLQERYDAAQSNL